MKKDDLFTSPLKKDATATIKAKLEKQMQGEADLISKGKHIIQLRDPYRKSSPIKEEKLSKPETIEMRMNAFADRMKNLNKDIKERLQGK